MGVVQDGLVLWLDARAQRQLMKDGQNKSVWKDLSGNGNHGQLMNFGYTEDSGWVDGGLKFDGVDDTVMLPNIPELKPNMFSIDLILKPVDKNGRHVVFVSWPGYTVELNVDKTISFGLKSPYLRTPILIEWGKLIHITCVYDGKTQYVYVNGKFRVQKDDTLSYSSYDVVISSTRYDVFKGSIFDVKFYNRALTDEEILQNYRATHFLLEPKTFTSTSYYNFYDLNRVEINTLATKDLAEVLRGDINLEDIDFDRDMKSIPFADVLNRVEGNINILGNKLYKPKGWVQPKLDWRYNQPFSYEDANRLERNLLLLYNYAKGNIDKIPYCGAYTCGEVVV